MRPFLAPITWSVTLALIAFPLCRRTAHWIPHHSLRAAIVTSVIGVTVILPTVWVLHSLFVAAITGIDVLVPNPLQLLMERALQKSPELAHAFDSLRDLLRSSNIPERAAAMLADATEAIVGTSVRGVIHSLIMLFIVFFLLRDGPLFLRGVARLVPLSEADTTNLLERIHDTIRATLLGMVAVAVLQGVLGSLLLWWLGIPGIVVWGTIMTLLALIPYLGTFIVWIPVAASLAVQGQWTDAVVTVVWGSVVIGLSDNVLYPHLVGQRLHYHSLLVFFFLVGGLFAFGAAGVVLGPVILAVTERLLFIWRRAEIGA